MGRKRARGGKGQGWKAGGIRATAGAGIGTAVPPHPPGRGRYPGAPARRCCPCRRGRACRRAPAQLRQGGYDVVGGVGGAPCSTSAAPQHVPCLARAPPLRHILFSSPRTYHGLAEVGAEATLVQRGRHELAKGGGLDVALLSQPVQVVLEGKPLAAAGGQGRTGRVRESRGACAAGQRVKPSCGELQGQVGDSRAVHDSQRLGIGAQPRQANEQLVVDLVCVSVGSAGQGVRCERGAAASPRVVPRSPPPLRAALLSRLTNLLVVCGQRLQLHAKPQVAADGHALLARHGHCAEGGSRGGRRGSACGSAAAWRSQQDATARPCTAHPPSPMAEPLYSKIWEGGAQAGGRAGGGAVGSRRTQRRQAGGQCRGGMAGGGGACADVPRACRVISSLPVGRQVQGTLIEGVPPVPRRPCSPTCRWRACATPQCPATDPGSAESPLAQLWSSLAMIHRVVRAQAVRRVSPGRVAVV